MSFRIDPKGWMRIATAVLVTALHGSSLMSYSSEPTRVATSADHSGGSGAAIARAKVLYIAGEKALVGNDGLIHDALKARNFEIEDATTANVTPQKAVGKQLIIVSYSVQSSSFKAADIVEVKVPIIVLEHGVLPALGMTDEAEHGYVPDVFAISMISNEPTLTAGMMGDVTVYTPKGKEMFWGTPGPGAIKVATAKGNASSLWRNFFSIGI